jgi:hypothetical protein
LHLDGSPHVIRLRRSLYGTSMPGAGAVHHITSSLPRRKKTARPSPQARFYAAPAAPRRQGAASNPVTAAKSPWVGQQLEKEASTSRCPRAIKPTTRGSHRQRLRGRWPVDTICYVPTKLTWTKSRDVSLRSGWFWKRNIANPSRAAHRNTQAHSLT